MNRKNLTYKPNAPVAAISWTREDRDEYAGGLQRPGFEGDAGYDLCASQDVLVPGGGFARVPTNVTVCIPSGFWGMLVGRSSTFFKRQLLVQTGIIDNGYRGALWCVVKNMSGGDVIVRRKERIMQLILFPLHVPPVIEVEELPPSARGANGFGSTGVVESETVTEPVAQGSMVPTNRRT